MPAWNAREGELKSTTEAQWKRAMEVEETGGPPVVQASYIVLLDALERHIDQRDRDLDEALDILEGPSSSATGTSQREEWSEHLREKGAKAFEAIADVADDDEEWAFFRTWVGSLAAQEAAFYKLLAQVPLARVQGRILEYTRAFEEEKEKLLDRWEAIRDRDGSVDEKMERVTDELREVFERALKRVSERNVSSGRKLHDFVKGASFVDQGTAPESPSLIQELVERPLDAIEHLVPDAQTLADRYRALYRSEETTVILFGETRASVREFLEATNLDRAEEEFEEARKIGLDLASTCLTRAQQDDARDFVEAAAGIVEDTLEEFEDAYEDFVDEFRGIFVGPVGDRTIEDLLETRRWDAVQGEWRRMNIQSELKRIHDEVEDWWGVSLNGVPDAMKDHLVDVLDRELEPLTLAVRRAEDWSYGEAAKFVFLDEPRMRLVDRLKSVRGYLE